LVVLVLASAGASSCAVGPDYTPPKIATPAAFDAVPVPEDGAAPPPDLRTWWDGFHDPVLSALIMRAATGNLDLMSMRSKLRQAREQTIIAGAKGLPQISADGNATHSHESQNSGLSELSTLFGGGSGSGGGFALPGDSITTYTVGFDASWEIDVFGGVRRGVEQAEDEAAAAAWNATDSEVSLSAEVAADYLSLRILQRQIALAGDSIERQGRLLALVEARRSFGLVTDLDVQEQRAQLASAEAAVPDLEANAVGQIHALGVLLGETPEALTAELTPPKALPALPPVVPVGLPSDLLRRRPDIRAAERSLAASNAAIGVATADLYPKFDLTGMFDFVSLDLRHLLSLSSRQYTATGAISWPIFEGGRINANIRATGEQNLQALYAYQKTVLGALRDVEDALTRYADERKKNQALHETLARATAALAIAQGQYAAGLTDFTPVLNAEGSVLADETQGAESDGTLDRDLVSLYKALGGGWDEARAVEPTP
jgi:NodT family efflux transporter outer membrane factor (OMF) lipoprotein